MTTNPYAPPKATVADIVEGEQAPALWNPNAAASWSLLFSPAFGAFLHMKNWQALGDSAKADTARNWVIASLVALFVISLASVFLPESKALDGLSRIISLVLLLTWYYSSGRPQAALVKARFGKTYPRRGWTVPLLLALGALVAFVLVIVAIAAIAGVQA